MSEVLGKDLDIWEDSLATQSPYNLELSDVPESKYISGSDLVMGTKITPTWQQPFLSGIYGAVDTVATTPDLVANVIAQRAVELTTKGKKPLTTGEKLYAGTEIGKLEKGISDLLALGMIVKGGQETAAEIKDKAKTYDEIVELLNEQEYPLAKYARRVIAETTDNVETRRVVRELYNQAQGIDSNKWYNKAGTIIGSMIPDLAVGRGVFKTSRMLGASRANAARNAMNVMKASIGTREAGAYAEETAAQYLERTGDKTFSNFTAEDATGLSALGYGAISSQIEFMGGVEPVMAGALTKIGLRTGLWKAGAKIAAGEGLEEFLQSISEFLMRKADGTNDKTWGQAFEEAINSAVWGVFIGGPMGMYAFHTNRNNLVKGIKKAVPNISDVQATEVANAMIDSVAEMSSQDPTLRNNLREKVATMYTDSDIENKEGTIDAITDLEYSLIAADSAERGIDIAENPLFSGEVNELGWFRAGIPEERRTEIQGYIDELNDLKAQLKTLNEVQEKDWAKIDEVENKLDKFNRYVLDKLSDLARADVRQALRENEEKYVRREKKRAKIPVDNIETESVYDNLKQIENEFTLPLKQNRVSGGAPSTYRGAYIPEYRFIQRANRMDASTLSHELAHDWFSVNFERYRSGEATRDFMRAWGALEKALGVEENAKVPPRKASEAFARAYEGWIMNKTDWEKLINVEDKDKEEIVKLMQDYQNNLRDIYQDLTNSYFKQTWGKLGELKPELVKWFDKVTNIKDLDRLVERGEMTESQASQEKLNRAIDTVIESTTDPEGKKQLEYARTLNDTQRYEAEGGNKNALQRRIGALAQAIDENNMLIKENYDTHRDMLEVAKQADNFVRTRLDDALAIINGQMAEQEGLFKEDIYTALERFALENGDLGLLDELRNSEIANRLAKELGQRVAGFRNWNAGEVDVFSAIKALDNKFNKALQNKKAQAELNDAERMFEKAQKEQDKLADKQLDSILKDMECK